MSLTLEVIGEKAARMGGAVRKTFTSGGTIGRLADSDWVFPDEYISGHHAKILFNGGSFLIEDTSTNGVFINSQRNRLAKGKPHPLRSGDTIFIDDYEVRVTLSQEPAAVESFAPVPGFSRESLMSDDPFFDGVPGSAGAPNAADPLALLGLQNERAVSSGPSAASLQNHSPLSQHYRPPTPLAPPQPPPSAKPPASAGVIPDDYDPMGSDEDPFASGPWPSVPLPVQEPAPVRAAPPSVRPPTPPRAASTPTVMMGPPRIPKPGQRSPAAAPRATVAQSPAAAPVAARPKPAPPTPSSPPAPLPSADTTGERRALPERRTSSRAAAGELDFAAMLQAAGIDSVRVTSELSRQFGMILRVVVAGLMDVLRARDKIKDEFRMRMTTFKQADNNPLKFSANVEDALHNLLVKRNAAYLGPVEAFEDAFLDVRNHQMAMLAGVRVAYEAMLAEFDPDRLQKEFDPQAKGANFLSGGAKAKYWELYRNRFRDMVKDADSSFRHLFGDDFAKAYEEQLSRLKASNRAERK